MPSRKTPPTLNRDGNGRGKKVVTRPQAKKRGASADRTRVIAVNRKKYTDTSAVPVAQLAEVIDPDKPLTEKAKLFVKFWAQGESVTTASARAGYGDGATYAYRLIHYPQVIALYNEEKRKYEEASQMTRKRVMDGLLEGIEMAKLVSEPASMINGWHKVGLMCGYFEPVKRRIDVNVSGSVTMRQMSGMSDAELLRTIQQGVSSELEAIERSDPDGP